MRAFSRSTAAALALTVWALPLPAQDSASLRHDARAAELRYERTVRWLAPGTYGGRGGPCDETVGRFCLTFDSLQKPPHRPERREVGVAREAAIAAQRAWLATAPGEFAAAGPLVRLLVEARRGEEAVAAAASFSPAPADSSWADWLSGYALHAAARDAEAEARFRRALARSAAAERARATSPEWLLDHGEAGRLKRLPPAERAAYEARFWHLADPMWRTPANEVWVEHVARHFETQLLARVPLVPGMLHWGPDLEELTVRYGVPIARERDYGDPTGSVSFIEHFDTLALAYAPESLRPENFEPPLPGGAWPLKAPSARSGHAPPAIRAASPLPHQLTRLPRGTAMRLRLDARVPLETGSGEAVLAVMPWRGDSVSATSLQVRGDSAFITLEVDVPRDSVVYSAEMFEPGSRNLRLARYLLPPLESGPVQLSDVLLTEPLPDSAPAAAQAAALGSLLLAPDQPVGLEAELAGVAPQELLDVTVSFARAGSRSLLARAAAWAGRRLGLGALEVPPRVRWQALAGDDAALRVNVRTPHSPGLYFVQVEVRTARGSAVSRRVVRVVSAG